MTFTVSITGVTNPIEVYDGLPFVDDYLGAAISDGATAWRALVTANDSDGRKRILVASTRFIDSLGWQGTPTTPAVGGTTLQWPRSNLTIDGAALDPSAIPLDIQNGVAELCALVADDPDVLSQADSGSNIQSLQAGTARLQFFRSTSPGDGNATVLPTVLNRLIGRYLAGASASLSLAGIVTGTSCHSDFECSCHANPCRCGGERNLTWPL